MFGPRREGTHQAVLRVELSFGLLALECELAVLGAVLGGGINYANVLLW